jgi:small subunit ribosomal protein S2
MSKIGIREMLEAGAHFGHQTRRWNPKMSKYIFGPRNGIHIIDLQQTVGLMRDAYTFIADTVANGGKVLFVGTKKQAQDAIAEEAVRSGQYYVNNRWLGGMLTNFKTIKQSVDRLRAIEEMSKDGTFEKLPKKEVVGLTRELFKLEKNLSGVKDMTKLPKAIFVIDPNLERIAVDEARKLGIRIVATLDTNCNPDLIDLPIPANDDSIRSVRLFVSNIADACLEGTARHEDLLAQKRANGELKEEGNGESNHRKASKRKQPQVDVIHSVTSHVSETNDHGTEVDLDIELEIPEGDVRFSSHQL